MSELERLHPCWYMKQTLPRLAEGGQSGLWLMYARLHVAKCPQCREALEALVAYIREAKSAPQTPADLPDQFWTAVESKLDQVDQAPKEKSG